MAALVNTTIELLQNLIRNECVNEGTVESGNELRSVDLLDNYLSGPGLDVQRYEPAPGRGSLVARIEGSEPSAPKICLMGHTDVVPVNPAGWDNDPFGGEIIDGELWGRGAIDMLNLTSSMAVAFKDLATSGYKPRGDLIYFAVADEEAGGHWGAEWMLDNEPEAVMADYVLTEMGGFGFNHDSGRSVIINVAEKGSGGVRLTVSGTPGHGSMPFGADNALLKAAEVLRRLGAHRPMPQLDDLWVGLLDTLGLKGEMRAALMDPERTWDAAEAAGGFGARLLHACSHMSISPNVVHGGQKLNVIPDTVTIDVDIRTLPGQDADYVRQELTEAIGELAQHVEIEILNDRPSSRSPQHTPMWDAIEGAVHAADPAAKVHPGLIVGGTDARYYRPKGAVVYGAGIFSPDIDMTDFGSRFHGNNERIDLDSLQLVTDFWGRVIKGFDDLGAP
ncbi:MAG: M20/M25/M40 family metallo-hydrolase [Actinomycetia bacterium]|nr:M20/M25/M40 family metallo-hydrolase [Actinomycetes bacterium]MCP4227555.1 M20/M25/M40 family metallo-hydrolase [Actinomycetes bacterium]MCP5034422.1 M20/M25/M40 family metallo-hydrolase [Actinomycetes bacterium]